MANTKLSSIPVKRRQKNLNIFIVIFIAITVYLILNVIMSLAKPHISKYEIAKGEVYDNPTFQGIAIRDEVVVNSAGSGYLMTLVPDNTKVGIKTPVYAISGTKLDFDKLQSKSLKNLNDSDIQNITMTALSFVQGFNAERFDDVYLLKESITSELANSGNADMQTEISNLVSSGTDVGVYNAATDGVLSYTLDGKEDTRIDNFSPSKFDDESKNPEILTSNTKVTENQPICKVIKLDNWNIAVPINKDISKKLTDRDSIYVKFEKDNQLARADLELKKYEGKEYAVLFFNDSMVRYASMRYINITLLIDTSSGLKIPKTSLSKKEFYVAPKSYYNKDTGTVLLKSKGSAKKMEVTVYYQDDSYIYLDPISLGKDAVLMGLDTNNTYELKEKKTLEGIYDIRSGYARFYPVTTLSSVDDYYIIKEGESFGPKLYMPIALNAKGLKEGDPIF